MQKQSFSETLVSNNYIQHKISHFFYTWVDSQNLPQPFIQTKNGRLRGGGKKQSNDLAVTPAYISWFLCPGLYGSVSRKHSP